MRAAATLLTIGLLLPTLFGCTKNSGSEELKNKTVKVAFLGSLTGDTSSFSKNTLLGIKMALDEARQDGLNLELIVKNNSGLAEKAVENMNAVVKDTDVYAVLGEVSSAMSLTVAPIAQQAGLPMITPTSTNPRVTEVGDFIFRICFIDPFQGFVMAKFAREHLKVAKVAVLKDRQSDYSKGLAEFFTATFQKLNGEVVMDEVYKTGDRDFRIQLEQIRKFQPEAIFLPGYYRDVAMIARQARKMGIQAQFLGGDGWDSDRLFEIGRDAVNGGYFSNHFALEKSDQPAQKFIQAFRKQHKRNPDGLAARGYDAANILIHALKASKSLSRAAVRDQLAQIKDFPGVTGPTSINHFRNADKPAVVVQVEGPMNRYVTTISPQADKSLAD